MRKTLGVVAFLIAFAGTGLAQSITVIQPAAGMTWNIGGTYTIQWTSTGVAKPTVKVMLWQGSTFIMDIAASAPISGPYSWTIPASVTPGSYKVRVRAIGADTLGVSSAFNIAAAAAPPGPIKVTPRAPIDRPIGRLFNLPALAITNITMSPNSEGFVVTFGYKNSGSGPMPKGSEMPVKPTFRVLIDGTEVNHGALFFPEVPAQPGWEVQTYQGCAIKNQPPYGGGQLGFDWGWRIGDVVTVMINENKVNGMASDSRSLQMKPIALQTRYDAAISDANLDWANELLTISVRLDGPTAGFTKFHVINSEHPDWWSITEPWGFLQNINIVPGQHQYILTQKMPGVKTKNECKINLALLLWEHGQTYPDHMDIDHRNNLFKYDFKR
jgi:hypothetical protein